MAYKIGKTSIFILTAIALLTNLATLQLSIVYAQALSTSTSQQSDGSVNAVLDVGLQPTPAANPNYISPSDTYATSTTADYNGYTLLEPLPCLDSTRVDCQNGQVKKINLDDFFQYAFNLLIALSAVAAVFMMTWGGFEYMTTDSWQGKENGKTKFNNAIIGLLMVLSAFLILKTVNPKLVEIPAKIDPIKVTTESPTKILDELAKDADLYWTENKQIANQVRASVTKQDDLQKKIDNIDSELNSNQLDPTTRDEKLLEKSKLNQQQTTEKANSAVGIAKIKFNNIILDTFAQIENHGILFTNYSKEVDGPIKDAIRSLDELKSEYIDQLRVMNATEQISGPGGLLDNAAAAEIKLVLSGVKWKLTNINYMDSYLNNVGSTIDIQKSNINIIQDNTLRESLIKGILKETEDLYKPYSEYKTAPPPVYIPTS